MFLPMLFAFGFAVRRVAVYLGGRAGFGGTSLPWGRVAGLAVTRIAYLCTVGKWVASLKIADFAGGLGGRPLLRRKVGTGAALDSGLRRNDGKKMTVKSWGRR